MNYTHTTEETFKRAKEETKRTGESVTGKAEERARQGKALDPLIDPAGFGVIRRAISWYEPMPGTGLFQLLRGVAMLLETRLDTTTSMGDSVDIAYNGMPRFFKVVKEISNAPLAKYDPQFITSTFGDVLDKYILCRSQAEMGKKIMDQMRMIPPDRHGYDPTEDPIYGLFGAAYLTDAFICKYGLKSYDWTVTDADSRHHVTEANLIRVFGKDVFEKVKENGYDINRHKLPDIKQIVKDLLKHAHAFVLLMGNWAYKDWVDIYGAERVVMLPSMNLLPEMQAATIALTEGIVGLSDLKDYLTDNMSLSLSDALSISRCLSSIPVGAQAELPNFDRVPNKGDIFKERRDLYPIEDKSVTGSESDDDDWC